MRLFSTSLKAPSTKLWTVPNVLSMSRIAATPVIGHFVVEGRLEAASALCVAAGVTDYLDGAIAKRWPSQRSFLGTLIDPLADKVMVVYLACVMGYVGLLPVPLVGVMLLRDYTLIQGTLYNRWRAAPLPKTLTDIFSVSSVNRVDVEASALSKANTFLSIGLIASSLGVSVVAPEYHSLVIAAVGAPVVAWTTWGSGAQYYVNNPFSVLKSVGVSEVTERRFHWINTAFLGAAFVCACWATGNGYLVYKNRNASSKEALPETE